MTLAERNQQQVTFALVVARRHHISLLAAIEIIAPAFAAQVANSR